MLGFDPGSILGKVIGALTGLLINFLKGEKQKVDAERAVSLEKQLESAKEADAQAKKDRAVLHAALLEPEISDDDWNSGGGHEDSTA